MMRKVVLDTETTGKEKGDRIVEIGLVEIDDRGNEVNELHYFFNPQQAVHAGALRVHKLSNEFLRDKPLFADKAKEIRDFLGGSKAIIHNAPFDTYYLNYEFALAMQRRGAKDGTEFTPVKKLCAEIEDTLELARRRFPGQSNSLDALIERFGIDTKVREERHGALIDAKLLAYVYIHLMTRQGDLIRDNKSSSASKSSPTVSMQDIASLGPFKTTPPDAEEQKLHAQFMEELERTGMR